MLYKQKHYNEKYFSWQKVHSEIGGWANKNLFKQYISGSDTVMDFGCGGGFLLKNLKCARKIGVEINLSAAECAKKNGIEVFYDANDIPRNHVDVIISNHALEHTLDPLRELKVLYKKMRVRGKIIFVVPCESVFAKYKPRDINNHLYSWSPMCIGNLFTEAGFHVIESKPYYYKWPPKFEFFARKMSKVMFEQLCRIYGRISIASSQVRIVAVKKAT